MKPEILQRLLAAGSGRAALALVTRLSDGRQALVDRQVLCGDLSLGADRLAAVAHSGRGGRSGALPQDEDLFVRVYARPPPLLVVGAVDVGFALAPHASLAGVLASVVRSRPA